MTKHVPPWWVAPAQKTPVGLAKRARAMMLLADGHSFAATVRQVELRERHVRKWALRFVAYGIDGLYNKKPPGRQPVFFPRRWQRARNALHTSLGRVGNGGMR